MGYGIWAVRLRIGPVGPLATLDTTRAHLHLYTTLFLPPIRSMEAAAQPQIIRGGGHKPSPPPLRGQVLILRRRDRGSPIRLVPAQAQHHLTCSDPAAAVPRRVHDNDDGAST